jgi:integrase/recombinase XerD
LAPKADTAPRKNQKHRLTRTKGNKERTTPLHRQAVEKLAAWLALPGISDDPAAPLFRPLRSARNHGRDGIRPKPMTSGAVDKLIERYVVALGLDPNVTVHSLRVTALTTARERASDIIDLQDLAGHANPRTMLTHIRTRDRLSKSPAYDPEILNSPD